MFGNSPATLSFKKKLQSLFAILHLDNSTAFWIYAVNWVFHQLNLFLFYFDQVPNKLIVNFYIVHKHLKLTIFEFLQFFKNLKNNSRQNSS
jgi:hypothetical protein